MLLNSSLTFLASNPILLTNDNYASKIYCLWFDTLMIKSLINRVVCLYK